MGPAPRPTAAKTSSPAGPACPAFSAVPAPLPSAVGAALPPVPVLGPVFGGGSVPSVLPLPSAVPRAAAVATCAPAATTTAAILNGPQMVTAASAIAAVARPMHPVLATPCVDAGQPPVSAAVVPSSQPSTVPAATATVPLSTPGATTVNASMIPAVDNPMETLFRPRVSSLPSAELAATTNTTASASEMVTTAANAIAMGTVDPAVHPMQPMPTTPLVVSSLPSAESVAAASMSAAANNTAAAAPASDMATPVANAIMMPAVATTAHPMQPVLDPSPGADAAQPPVLALSEPPLVAPVVSSHAIAPVVSSQPSVRPSAEPVAAALNAATACTPAITASAHAVMMPAVATAAAHPMQPVLPCRGAGADQPPVLALPEPPAGTPVLSSQPSAEPVAAACPAATAHTAANALMMPAVATTAHPGQPMLPCPAAGADQPPVLALPEPPAVTPVLSSQPSAEPVAAACPEATAHTAANAVMMPAVATAAHPGQPVLPCPAAGADQLSVLALPEPPVVAPVLSSQPSAEPVAAALPPAESPAMSSQPTAEPVAAACPAATAHTAANPASAHAVMMPTVAAVTRLMQPPLATPVADAALPPVSALPEPPAVGATVAHLAPSASPPPVSSLPGPATAAPGTVVLAPAANPEPSTNAFPLVAAALPKPVGDSVGPGVAKVSDDLASVTALGWKCETGINVKFGPHGQVEFEESLWWDGARPGYVFKKDHHGLGYYIDTVPASQAAWECHLHEMGWSSGPQLKSDPRTGEPPSGPKTGEPPSGPKTGEPPSSPQTGEPPSGPQTGEPPSGPQSILRKPPAAALEIQEPPYSRNAAAKLIERVKRNAKRMSQLDADVQALINSDKDDDRKRLLDLVVGARGNMDQVQTSFEFESNEVDSDLTNMVPVTEKELERMYGEKTAEVKEHKERMGLCKDDPNLPGGKVYQVFRDQVTTGTKITASASSSSSSERPPAAREPPSTLISGLNKKGMDGPTDKRKVSFVDNTKGDGKADDNKGDAEKGDAGGDEKPNAEKEPKQKKPKTVKVTPTTALDRGNDLLTRILDKKKTAESHKTDLYHRLSDLTHKKINEDQP
ncbi:unnamed protein product [Symbiodinium sp. CCMP2592]|nr:unnamed protein product [Symbiodinium sp. CCMP2592]